MTQAPFVSKFPGTILVFAASLLVGCTPLNLSDIHTTSTPRSQLFDVAELAREPVATLGLLTSASLQGFNPPLSHALNAALSEASPPSGELPPMRRSTCSINKGWARSTPL